MDPDNNKTKVVVVSHVVPEGTVMEVMDYGHYIREKDSDRKWRVHFAKKENIFLDTNKMDSEEGDFYFYLKDGWILKINKYRMHFERDVHYEIKR